MRFECNTFLLTACLILLTTISTYDAIALDGIVPLLQDHFALDNSHTAWMKTISSTATTVVLLLMGIGGDRIGRRFLMLSTGFLWTVALCASLLSGGGQYWLFIICRALVSSGSAIFSVIVPVVLADLYRDSGLGRAIMVNSLMELIGNLTAVSLSSVVVASSVTWKITFLPVIAIGAFTSILLIFLLPRDLGDSTYEKRNLFDALKLFKVKSYLFLSGSAILTGFYTKTNLFWFPTFVLSAWTYLPKVFFDLPYPVVMTATSTSDLIGSLIGLPLWLWIAQSWQFGRYCFSCVGMFDRALPVVATLNSFSLSLSSVTTIWASGVSYIVVAIGSFLSGFMGFSAISLSMQMTLSVSDARRRASALSLQRLLVSLISIPGPQIIGAVADVFRGDSELDADRFKSYEKALAINWSTIFFSSFFLLAATFFYASDARNVRGPLRLRAMSEKDPLLNRRQSRTASVLEQSLMGRRATLESIRR